MDFEQIKQDKKQIEAYLRKNRKREKALLELHNASATLKQAYDTFKAYGGTRTTKEKRTYYKWETATKYGDETIEASFNMGEGHYTYDSKLNKIGKAPTMLRVIVSIYFDGQCALGSFEDFCRDMGYDTDSRKALETYLECQKSGEKLRVLNIEDRKAIEAIAQDW